MRGLATAAEKTVSAPAASSVWATNGGIYFGHQIVAPANLERPLSGKEKELSVPPSAAVKTSWQFLPNENRYTQDRHVLTIGPNGSGKTRKLLMPNLFRLRDWSCVVIDPKGELAAHTAVFRASREGHKVVVIDPFRAVEKNYPDLFAKHPEILRSKGYNPVASLDPESDRFVDDAKTLATALIRTDNTRDPYWPMAAQSLVKGLLLTTRLVHPNDASLSMLRDDLSWPADVLADILKDRVAAYRDTHPAVASSLGQFTNYTPEDRELNGIVRTALVQTDWLDSPQMQRDLQ